MNTERIQPHFGDARDPVVTYSRLPSRPRPSAPPPAERVEPRLDAAEVPLLDPYDVPLVDPHDDVDPGFAEVRPEVRADPVYAEVRPEQARRPRSMSVMLLGATFAILAGFGVLAGTIGVATVIPGETPAESEPVSEPALRLTSGEALPDPEAERTAVREIPLAVGEETPAAEAVANVAPPLPRPRPEVKAASLERPQPLEAKTEPKSDVASVPVLPPPDKAPAPPPAWSLGSSSGAAVSPTPAPQPRGTDALISDIEQTLAKIDRAPAGSASANVAGAPPAPLAPPPAVDPSTSVLSPSYPLADEECPPSDSMFGPCYDVMPPDAMTGNGYYVPEPGPPAYDLQGPVPPEPVPYPSAIVGGSTFSDEAAEEPERPGFVRRAITRTADAVSRVFGRDRDRDSDNDNNDVDINISND